MLATIKNEKNSVTVREAAQLSGLSESRIREMIRTGKIRACGKRGREWMIPYDQIPERQRVRLTPEERRRIAWLYKNSSRSSTEIGRQFGIKRARVWQIYREYEEKGWI